MYFDIKCIGKLLGPMNEFERSLVFETGEFERPKIDCILLPLLCSMSLISPNFDVKSTIFPNFSQEPFPKIARKSPVRGSNILLNKSLARILISYPG